MRIAARAFAALSLAGSIVPALLYLAGSMSLDTVKAVMLVSTAVWFLAAPLAMKGGSSDKSPASAG